MQIVARWNPLSVSAEFLKATPVNYWRARMDDL